MIKLILGKWNRTGEFEDTSFHESLLFEWFLYNGIHIGKYGVDHLFNYNYFDETYEFEFICHNNSGVEDYRHPDLRQDYLDKIYNFLIKEGYEVSRQMIGTMAERIWIKAK